MKNVTITLEDDVLEWARIEAAKRGLSVSRMVGDMLGDHMRAEDAYAQAMRSACKFKSFGVSSPATSSSQAEGAAAQSTKAGQP
jgi:hypothetical protein